MKNEKAQAGIELMMIIGALFFFVSLFLLAIQENMESKVYQRESILVKEIALTVQNEINMALQAMDGYYREFEIPQRAGNLEYEIGIDPGAVFVKTTNNRHALALPIINVTGDINITTNVIEKINGQIYLNK